MGLPSQVARPCACLTISLQRCQPLHGIEKLGTKIAVGFRPSEAGLVVEPVKQRWGYQGNKCGGHQHGCDGQIEEGDKTEDGDRCQDGNQHLGQELAEIGFELFDAVDHGEDDVARAFQAEPGGAEGNRLVIERFANADLDQCRRMVRDHGAGVFQQTAQHHDDGDQHDRFDELGKVSALKYLGDQPAEQRQTADADRGSQAGR